VKLRTRVLATYIFLTAAGIFFAGVFSSWQIRGYLRDRLKDDLATDVELLSVLFSQSALGVDESGRQDSTLLAVARRLQVHLTLASGGGRVLFDSVVPRDSLSLLGTVLNRPEIAQARDGAIGRDLRDSRTPDQEILHFAKRLPLSGMGVLDSGYVSVALEAEQIAALDARVQAILLGVGFVTIVLITITSVHLSKRISRPIDDILRTTRAIRDGDLNQRIKVVSNDEIGQLSTAINSMAEKLSQDIIRLRKLEHIRSEFLGNVSHELRTPIFSIQGFLETLLDGAVDDPSVNRDFLAKAHRHAEGLNTLLNDLIEISRIESGEMKMSFRYFSVVELAQQVVDEMQPDAEKRSISLSLVHSVPQSENVYGDRDRVKQVMVNLIDNAVKYTDPGGTIQCAITPAGLHVQIHVRDTGCGIPEEHLPRVFERFYRVDKNRSRQVGGTGLGLAIVKHIVEAHGGTLQVTSTVGKGSEFTFSLRR